MLWGPHGKAWETGNCGQEPSVVPPEGTARKGKQAYDQLNVNNLGGHWGIKVSLVARYLPLG